MNPTAIESKIIRAGGSIIPIGDTEYHFKPYTDGAHVCEVANEEHADRFLSITEGYRLYRGQGRPVNDSLRGAVPDANVGLSAEAPHPSPTPALFYGRDFPSSFDIHGATYALGDIALRAYEASGLSTEAWNSMPDDERDGKIEAELDRIEAAGPVAAIAPPVAADDRAALAAEYERLYGKKPHHNTGIDKLREAIAAKQ